jgi:hypothetical protein
VKATVAVAALVFLAACGDRADFDRAASFTDIEDAITNGGLEICEAENSDDGRANQAVESRQYEIAFDCDGDATLPLDIDEYDAVEDRDAAARNFESQARPRGYGAVWTYGPFTIFTFGERDDAVEERLTDVLDGLGAE